MEINMDKNLLADLKKQFAQREADILSGQAAKSGDGIRKIADPSDEVDLRPKFYRDADRILHSSAFSRYIDKTQVFYLISNDLITHRMIHVQLLSKIARTIGRALRLNEDLIEAIALGHDIGHPPFGHDGEEYLSRVCQEYGIKRFLHNVQSVIFLEQIENKGYGLNLTLQVLDGILTHDGEKPNVRLSPNRNKNWATHETELREKLDKGRDLELAPMTLEGCVVKISDTISYIGRDIEDAITVKLIRRKDLPSACSRVLGNNNRKIVDTLVKDVISNSVNQDSVGFSAEVAAALQELKEFNYQHIYLNPLIKTEADKIEKMFKFLFEQFIEDIATGNTSSRIYRDFLNNIKNEAYLKKNSAEIVRDFIAGMTDDYFNDCFKEIYLPKRFYYEVERRRENH
jgi:dGTPase